ncbi:MAG TPA: NADH-quinone oxidoreductase subunit NuoE [bacterium]|nr:NADH-quinone oxidoreductase subunit NuoE [bacterium]HPN34309.1 NADH-quinone oxidoreductase subunit NuoE [bacterium]
MQASDVYSKYPGNDPSVLIPILQDVQEVYGYVPEEELHNIAKHTRLPVSRVFGVATFYNQFRLTPLGKNVIRVCRGTACHVKGSLDILTTLETELGIKAGGTTRDGQFTIETVACMGACSIAPVISINDEFFGGLTVKEVQKLIASRRAEKSE